MASFSTSMYFIILYFFTFYFISLIAESNSSFSFNNFGHNSSLDSVLALYGDAKIVNNSLSLQLTAPSVSSSGRVIYKKPIKFYGGIPKKLISFSTYFSFSISPNSRNRDALAFVVFSNGDNFKFLSVEFDTLMGGNYREMNWNGNRNGNHVRIQLSNFVNLRLNSGNRLQVWIDYESSSSQLEVRLSKFGQNRPLHPLLFERIDLLKILPQNKGVFVGLSSSNGNSSQLCNVYSWSFKTLQSSDWMHSEPLDPIVFKDHEENEITIRKKSGCVLRILSALILGIGLGGLGSLIGMFMWTIFAKRRPVSHEEFVMKHVVNDKSSANVKQ